MMQNIDYSDPFAAQQAQAQASLQAAQQAKQYRMPKEQGMVGRVYVGTHPLQHLAEILRTRQAQNQEDSAMEKLQGIGQQRQEAQGRDMSAFVQALRGTPAQPAFEAAGPAPQGAPQEGGYTVPAQAAKAGDPYAAYSLASSSQSPMVRQMGMQGMAQLPQLEQQAALKREEIAQRSLDKAEDRANRIEMARLTASNRPERMVTVLGPNGEAMSMPQSQAQAGNMELYNPLRAKQIQTEQGKKVGQTGLSETLDTLSGYYNTLNENSGIPSKDNRVLTNLGAAVSSTKAGNFAGRMLGTENADARDKISQTRPLLLADIKKATGMTASEMNSNAELQMWLSTATDPSLGFEANVDALRNLENKFGLGRGKGTDANPFLKKKPATATANPQDAAAMEWARSNPNDPRSAQILQRLGGQ